MRLYKKKQLKYDSVINSILGKLGVVIVDKKIARIDFLSTSIPLIPPNSLAAKRIISKIKKYFCDPNSKFNLTINLSGTVLQQKIWRLLRTIPVGATITYGELAKIIKTSPRVIGNACRRNPVPIIIPCHRVVAASGLGGYCGKTGQTTLKIKMWLLNHERKIS